MFAVSANVICFGNKILFLQRNVQATETDNCTRYKNANSNFNVGIFCKQEGENKRHSCICLFPLGFSDFRALAMLGRFRVREFLFGW